MMTLQKEILQNILKDLEKGLDVLTHSYDKCRQIKFDHDLSYSELESFEALTSRFARLSDIVTQKALRTLDILDLEEEGSLRDRINRAEKKGICDAEKLTEVRMLRNEIAHEYRSETLYAIFKKVLDLTPFLPMTPLCMYLLQALNYDNT